MRTEEQHVRISRDAAPRIGRVALVLAGAAFGVTTSMVNHGFGPAAGYVSKVLGSGSIWLLAGFCAALTGYRWRDSFTRSIGFLLPAVAGYYLADTAAGVYTLPSFDDPTGPVSFDLYSVATDLGFYVVAALAASAVLGLVVTLIQRDGIVGLLASAAVPGYIAVTALTLHRRLLGLEIATDPAETAATWWIGIGALILTIAAIPIRFIAGRMAGNPRTTHQQEQRRSRSLQR